MEKDHFKDRSYHCKYNDMIQIGDVVYICLKENQKRIKSDNIDLLTKGIVLRKLTNKKYHPRGIKLYIFSIRHNVNPTPEQIDKVIRYYNQNRKLIDSGENKTLSAKFVIGRGVYLLDSNGNKL